MHKAHICKEGGGKGFLRRKGRGRIIFITKKGAKERGGGGGYKIDIRDR